VGRADDFAPLLGFVGNELPKVGGRERKHVATEVGKPRLHLGLGKASVDLLVELADDLSRCASRHADTVPNAGLIARQELTNGRDVRQRVGVRRGAYWERTQPAGLDVPD